MAAPDPEPRHDHGVERTYRGEAIEVLWEPALCIHTGICVRAVPPVFRPQHRPWVMPDAAAVDRIADAILRCPTGALHFTRTDGGAHEEDPDHVEVQPVPHGPLYVRGRVTVRDADGDVVRDDVRMALCRCGRSGNKPFCDGSHMRVMFDDG